MQKTLCSILVLKIAATSSAGALILLQVLLTTTLLQQSQAAPSSYLNRAEHYNTIPQKQRLRNVGVSASASTSPTSTPPQLFDSTSRAECFDTFLGWSDVGGPKYNCEWYAKNNNNCADYGNFFENYGSTAKEVCCSCGGGGLSSSSNLPPTTQPTSSPTSKPTVSVVSIPKSPSILDGQLPTAPTTPSTPQQPAPSSLYPCTDSIEGWYDIGGPVYNCEWYSIDGNCDDYGAFFAREGKTANDVCCACGGGVYNEEEDDDDNNANDDNDTTPALTPSGSSGGSDATESPTSDIISALNQDEQLQPENTMDFMTYIYIAIGALITGVVWFLTRSEYFK
mmetsp:Transcript_18390/g.23151  ORF Transcript_18390/g.23151 Transcript_18390/m.23151 type:complete len:338 (-) Transcript_18390:168-1181(-)